jgi:undecaprenyl-diphosphatase
MEKTDRYYIKTAIIWIAGWTVFRCLFAGHFLLTPDEANYWQWGRHLALSYHDQAPLIGWAIGLSTKLLGHTEFAVRLPTILAMTIASLYLVAMAARWFSAKTALAVALITQGVLEFNVGGLISTADGVQAAAWAGAAYHTARAFEDNTWKQWLAAGLFFGLGLLAKYTMVLFAPCVYVYGLLNANHRPRLFGIKPYAGLLAGSLLFTPVIVWNAAHGWSSARHVAFIGGAEEAFALRFDFLGDYLASQAALVTPLLFVAVLWAWWLAARGRYQPKNWMISYCFWTSFPVFALFLALSLKSRVYGNWPGAGFLTASLLAAAFFAPRRQKTPPQKPLPRPRFWKACLISAYLITLPVLVQTVWPVLPIPVKLDRTLTELSGWDQIGITAGTLKNSMPKPENTFLFGLRYQEASQLAFYTPGNPQTVSINRWGRPNVYDYWWEDEDLLGKDAIGVTRENDLHKHILPQVFERVDPPIALHIMAKRQEVRTVYLYRAYGFKGGLRWIPPSSGDIRKTG